MGNFAGSRHERRDPSCAALLPDIPAAERERSRLDGPSLEAELDAITDADTDRLAYDSAGRAGRRPWVFRNLDSRLLVDPERFPDERE